MAPGLCENCHKRPKFGTHRFCGTTCAAQAATKPVQSNQSQPQGPRNTSRQQGRPLPKQPQLCTYCGQKPKHNNFDYCGKSCAALANAAQSKPSTTQGASTTKQKRTQNAPPNNVSAPTAVPAKAHKAAQPKPAVPQSSTEEDEESEEDGGVSTDLDAYPSDSGSESDEVASVPAPQPGAKSTSKGSKSGSGAPGIAPGTCAIPKCGQPPHVDRNGVKTKYCSTKHREESVKLGLEAACIMCQRYPQGSSDYFCSSGCRDQSMTKT